MKISTKNKASSLPKDQLLSRLTLKFFSLPRFTAILWIALTIFGVISYTTLLRREGFPSVQIPLAVVNGAYFTNDPQKVDAEVAKPISDIAKQNPAVSAVQSSATDNFFNVTITYKEGSDADAVTAEIEKSVKDSGKIPEQVQPVFNVPDFGVTGGDIDVIDVAISFYSTDPTVTTDALVREAEAFKAALEDKKLPNVSGYKVKNPLQPVTNPQTGQEVTVQRSFDRYGIRENDKTEYYSSVLIAVAATDNVDVIKLDKEVRTAIDETLQQPRFEGYSAAVSGSFAPAIKDNISELQKVLLEGLLAVLVVGSIVIAVRASFITVLSMVTVILTTIGLLYLIGYTLNVITLFGLILGLSLIVDDTIIMVEAIEAARRKTKTAREAVRVATRKVSRAMVAATGTAALCFLPLALVGGVLGSFIRAIPVTIISSLIISLLVALIFIPFFSRFLLLNKKQMAKKPKPTLANRYEEKAAALITAPMLWARGSKRKLIAVGLTAIFISFGFVGGGIALSQKVVFNIFPPTKDTNGLFVTLTFPEGTDVAEAQQIATRAERLSAETLKENFVQATYYASGSPQSANLQIELVPYGKRDVTSPQLVQKLKDRLKQDFTGAQFSVAQVDLGPPAAAFSILIKSEDRDAAYKLSEDIKSFLQATELKRLDGSVAQFTDVNISSRDQFLRNDGETVVQLNSGFDGTDTTTLVTLAQNAINERYDETKLASFGLDKEAVAYNLGQESENQDSFKTLAVTFPLLLIAIFLLLALEFRSLLQPLLIFMAIPFSIFGLMLGLYLTDNAISFFASLGFFALIGLSIKNTILLTDFANQSRAAGLTAVESAAAAISERFRPLIATSITAVFSLIPLAITSPFWQGLAVVLIFGLASSTILVLLVFPYYYLGVEYLRLHISRKQFLAWFILTAAVCYGIVLLTNPGIAAAVFALSLVALIIRALVRPSMQTKRA